MSTPATPPRVPSPFTRAQVADAYFMEHRARVLDIAAFLDRLDRAGHVTGAGGSASAPGSAPASTTASITASTAAQGDDFRIAAFRRALAVLSDGKPERARRVLELLSDTTTEPIAKAPMKGATGAFDPRPAQ